MESEAELRDEQRAGERTMNSMKNNDVLSVVGPSEARPSPARWLWQLVRCVWYLGPRLGWRYWKIQRIAHAQPDFLGSWAFRCRCEANECEWAGDDDMAEALRGWACQLDKHAAYRAAGGAANNKITNEPPSAV